MFIGFLPSGGRLESGVPGKRAHARGMEEKETATNVQSEQRQGKRQVVAGSQGDPNARARNLGTTQGDAERALGMFIAGGSAGGAGGAGGGIPQHKRAEKQRRLLSGSTIQSTSSWRQPALDKSKNKK